MKITMIMSMKIEVGDSNKFKNTNQLSASYTAYKRHVNLRNVYTLCQWVKTDFMLLVV